MLMLILMVMFIPFYAYAYTVNSLGAGRSGRFREVVA